MKRVVHLQPDYVEKQPVPTKGKSCFIIRYGAIGDMMQMSSILPELRKQGYKHIVLNTQANGYEVMKYDPNIDVFLIQKKDEIENAKLGEYWATISEGYEKVINLCESVEAALVAVPGRKQMGWSKEFRQMVMGGIDYVAGQHAMARVPFAKNAKFYPSVDERNWAQKQKKKLNGAPVVLWALSGSSVNKAYPYVDNIVASLMIETKAVVVFVGDNLCKVLEVGWEKETRVKCRSGEWSIRQSLAFAQVADIVVGVDTGVLNAVAHEQTPRKILLLTHNTKENVGDQWVNTVTMEPDGCHCYPCLTLHYGWSTCNRDEETGGALCASRINPDKVLNAILEALNEKQLS